MNFASLMERRLFLGVVAVALLGLAAAAVTATSQGVFAGNGSQTCATQDANGPEGPEVAEANGQNDTDGIELECKNESESAAQPGTIDDGKELLPQASISLEQAISAAQGAASGELGEVDLEHYQGKLVFNVEIGRSDVKVDAATGTVLGVAAD